MRKVEENSSTIQKQFLLNSSKLVNTPNKNVAVVGKTSLNTSMNNYYQENRTQSMSHIRQLNPKNKNFIIPVLPSNFFSK